MRLESEMNRRGFLSGTLKLGLGVAATLTYPKQALSLPQPKLRFGPGDDEYYERKIKYPNRDHPGDIIETPENYKIALEVLRKLRIVFKKVGKGAFYTISYDNLLAISSSKEVFWKNKRKYRLEAFTKQEKDYIEVLFYEKANKYGFYGKKPIKNLTHTIDRSKFIKMDQDYYFGQRIYKGPALETLERIKQLLAVANKGKKKPTLCEVTSGVRSVTCQLLFFLSKLEKVKGNLSAASRSLAPTGYSYHGVSDFDVGKVGDVYWNHNWNFETRFETTDVHEILSESGFIQIRYPETNLSGVRYEPWHVKVDGDINEQIAMLTEGLRNNINDLVLPNGKVITYNADNGRFLSESESMASLGENQIRQRVHAIIPDLSGINV